MTDRGDELRAELAALEDGGRLRQRPVIDGPAGRIIRLRGGPGGRWTLLNWASNDYLGALHKVTTRNAAVRAVRQHGSSAGAARLLAGGLAIHRRLEQALAHFFHAEDCLLTSSGYQANQALLTSLANDKSDHLIMDRLCHASSYDGARLSAGRISRFAHNDVNDLDKKLAAATGRRRLVVVESIYSMDGDEAPLPAIADCCRRHDAWLVVDEAHALGVAGPGGRGLCAAHNIVPDALVGTCSKALAGQGGFIVGKQPLVDVIVNRGRSFIYSTALNPAAAGASLAVLKSLLADAGQVAALQEAANALRQALQEQGWQVPDGNSPIIPVIVGSEGKTLAISEKLRELGHYAPSIRPPTVPEGSCRLRLTVTLAHRQADRRRLVASMGQLAAEWR